MQTETLALGTASRACSGNKLYESMVIGKDNGGDKAVLSRTKMRERRFGCIQI